MNFLLPILSGILLCLSLPPWGNGILVWIALVPLHLFLLNTNRSTKQKLIGGFITGALYFLVALWPLASVDVWWWIAPDTFFFKIRSPLWTLGIILLSLYGAVSTYVLYSFLFLKIHSHPWFKEGGEHVYSWRTLITLPLVWMIVEMVRTATVFGFGWAHLGYDLYNNPYIAHIAHWIGIDGLTGFIMYINIALSYTAHRYLREKKIPAGVLTIAIILFSSLFVWGYISIRTYDTQTRFEARTTNISVSLINTNTQTDATTPETYNYIFSLMNTAATSSSVVVLPENIFPLFILNEQTHKPLGYEKGGTVNTLYDSLITTSTQHPQTLFLIGMHTRSVSTPHKEHNGLIALRDGHVTDVYKKRKVLPFSEARVIQESSAVSTQDTTISAVDHDGTPVTFHPLICSEIMLPDLVHDASIILNISNNGVLENPRAEQYNHAVARMRALEQRAPLIHSEKDGLSSLIDPFGRIITEATYKEKEIVSGFIRLPH